MTFAITPAPAPAQGQEFNQFIQWRAGGVDLGEPNVQVVDLIDPDNLLVVTRGVGDNAHVVTVRDNRPPPTYQEDYEHDLTLWPTVVGSSGFFSLVESPWGPLTPGPYETPERAIHTAAGAFGQNAKRRTISFPLVSSVSLKFKVDALGGATNDSSSGAFAFTSSPNISFIPRGSINNGTSPSLSVFGSTYRFGGSSDPLTLGTWYMLTLAIAPGEGNSVATIRDLSGGLPGTVVRTQAVAGDNPPISNITEITVSSGVPGVTPHYPTTFDDIICFA